MSLYSLKKLVSIPYKNADIPVRMSLYTHRKKIIYAFKNKFCMYSFNKKIVYTPLKNQCVLSQRNQYILLIYEVYTHQQKSVYTPENVAVGGNFMLLFLSDIPSHRSLWV